jgi:GT2 family glycosyltransferase
MTAPGGKARVAAIVVNFNAGEALIRCIRSVLAQDETTAVIVVDNASADDSADHAERLFRQERRVAVLRNAANPGFATAVNQGVRHAIRQEAEPAAGGYLLILNPDCELRPGMLAALVKALEDDPGAALAGPLVTDTAGRPQRATMRRFPDPWLSLVTFSGLWRLEPWLPAFRGVESPAGLPREIARSEAVSGACMLVRAKAFIDVGGLDEGYALHCEDLDLMYRLRERGGHCLFVPQAQAEHLQGVSSRSRPLWVHWQTHRGMQRFYLKFQAPRCAAWLRWPFTLLVLTGIWTRFAVTLPLALLRR